MPGFEANGWAAIGAPKNTPVEIIDKLNKEINTALAHPRIKARLAEFVVPPFVGAPADLDRFVAEETQKWAKVIRAANIKL